MFCPYCQTPIVDDPQLAGQTVACPRCGQQFVVPGKAARPVVIEQTAKRYKLIQLTGALVMVPAFILVLTGAIEIGLVGLLLGLVVYLWGRTLAWWHHG